MQLFFVVNTIFILELPLYRTKAPAMSIASPRGVVQTLLRCFFGEWITRLFRHDRVRATGSLTRLKNTAVLEIQKSQRGHYQNINYFLKGLKWKS
jgi:hypothetical protein